MKSAYLVFSTIRFWGLASGQNSNQTLPACAETCAAGFTTPGLVAGCPLANIACICSNSTFISSISCCLAANCDQADQAQAIGFADQLCSDNGVTVATAVICLTGSSTSTASTTTSASTTTASSNLTTTNTASTTTRAFTTTTTASTTSTKASSSASAVSTGGAAQNRAGLGVGFAGGLLAALAFLG